MAKASLTSKFNFYLMLELLDLIFKTLGAEKDDNLTVISHFHAQTLGLTLESVNETQYYGPFKCSLISCGTVNLCLTRKF